MLQAAAAACNRRVTILRPFAFTGEFDGAHRLFPLILQAALENTRQPLTAGTQIRDFCAVGDIARAVTQVMAREEASLLEIYNLGSGLSLTVRQVIESVCEELDLKADLAFGEKQMRSFEPPYSVANIAKAEAQLGWTPRTRVPYAVWELAQQLAQTLPLKRPARDLTKMTTLTKPPTSVPPRPVLHPRPNPENVVSAQAPRRSSPAAHANPLTVQGHLSRSRPAGHARELLLTATPTPTPAQPASSRVCILVPTYKRNDALLRILHQTREQIDKYRGHNRYELCVADSRSGKPHRAPSASPRGPLLRQSRHRL